MPYYFYRLDDHATVHDAACGHCRYGHGQKKANDHRVQSEWVGPFQTSAEASARAARIGIAHVRVCLTCHR